MPTKPVAAPSVFSTTNQWKHSTAPSVYRPQQSSAPGVGMPPPFRPHTAPVQRHAMPTSGAPPVYRPSATFTRSASPAYVTSLPVQAKPAHTAGAPRVYRPVQTPVHSIQRQSASQGTGAPPVYRPAQTVMRVTRPLALSASIAPPAFTPHRSSILQAYFTHGGKVLTPEELKAFRAQVGPHAKAFDVIAKNTVTSQAISAWLKDNDIVLKSGGETVSVTKFLKTLDMDTESESSDSGSSSDEEEGGHRVLHRGDSLTKGLLEKQAWGHASEDIRTKQQVFDDLPRDVQDEVHKLAVSSARPFSVGVKKTVKPGYIVSVAPLSSEKARRSEPTGHPVGPSAATFRMVGTVGPISSGKPVTFNEVSGTSYENMTPTGYFVGTHTQNSHVMPSMLLSPEHRASGGNTTVVKSTFVNQTYDRGSEEAIYKHFSGKKGMYVAAVELMDTEEEG